MIDWTASTAREVRFTPSNPAHARRALAMLNLHFREFGHETILDDGLFASDLAQLVANCPELEFEARHVVDSEGIERDLFDERLAYFRAHADEAARFEEHASEEAQYHGLRDRDRAMIALLVESGTVGSGCLRLDTLNRIYSTVDERFFAYF
jgi:hypothetical protein